MLRFLAGFVLLLLIALHAGSAAAQQEAVYPIPHFHLRGAAPLPGQAEQAFIAAQIRPFLDGLR